MESSGRRVLFRFTLRSILILTAVVAIWLGIRVNKAIKLRRAIDVFETGCLTDSASPVAPSWLQRAVGREYFIDVIGWDVDVTKYSIDHGGPDESALAVLSDLPIRLRLLRVRGDARTVTVTDHALDHIAEMTALEDLELWHCDVTAGSIERLGRLKRLRTLFIDSRHLTDDDLIGISQLQQLEDLTLNRTQITDRGLEHLVRLRRLHKLSLEGNRLTDAGLVQLKRLVNLTWLDLLGCSDLSPVGLADLESALPNCVIRHDFE